MNRIRIITLALGFFAATPMVAQQDSDSAARTVEVRERLAKISRQLNLTPQQTAQLKPVIQQEVVDLRAVKDKHKGDTSHAGRETKAREIQGVRQKYELQINAVLTPEQQAQWKTMKEAKKEKVKAKKDRKPGTTKPPAA
jgi:Spy/CpxP family protein refolding chaperone